MCPSTYPGQPKDGPPSPKPRPKSKRKRQALLPRTSPIKTPTPSPTKRNRGDSNTQIEYTNTKMQHIRGIFDPNPLNLFERRIRPYKPPAQKPPPKDKSPTTQAQPKSQPPNENTLKDIPTYNLRPSHKKQLHRPKPIQHATFILCDGEGRVEEYIIFKEAEKFYGNLYLFHDFTEDLKDCDVQTTFDERLAGEEHSAQVLAQTIARISRMKVNSNHL